MLDKLIRKNYTYFEAEEILAFLKEHNADNIIESHIRNLENQIEEYRCTVSQ